MRICTAAVCCQRLWERRAGVLLTQRTWQEVQRLTKVMTKIGLGQQAVGRFTDFIARRVDADTLSQVCPRPCLCPALPCQRVPGRKLPARARTGLCEGCKMERPVTSQTAASKLSRRLPQRLLAGSAACVCVRAHVDGRWGREGWGDTTTHTTHRWKG